MFNYSIIKGATHWRRICGLRLAAGFHAAGETVGRTFQLCTAVLDTTVRFTLLT
jgi:hypothetical protein